MKRTKISTLVAAGVVTALALTGCVKSSSSTPTSAAAGAGTSTAAGSAAPAGKNCATGPVKVGYIPKLGTDPYMTTVRDGAMDAAKEIGGSVIYTQQSEATGAAQIPFVNQLISQGVGVIAISGSDLNGAAAALKAAQAKGIKVISFDSDVATDARSLFINQADTAELGTKMLDSMAGMMGSAGEFAILSSTQTAVNQNAWIASMKTRLANDPKLAKMKLDTIAYGQEKADVNAQKAKELVSTYPNLKGIIVPAGIGLPAAAEALTQSGDLGKVKITGLAPASIISKYIKTGNVQDIWWNVTDLGYLSYYAAQALAQCKADTTAGSKLSAGRLKDFTIGKNGEIILGPSTIVTPANVTQFKF